MQTAVFTQNMAFQTSYAQNQVFTASREQLILMLYEGAIKFINQGVQAQEEKKPSDMSWNLLRAQKIVHYLDMSLNMREGREIAENMSRLYGYINRRLSDGHLKQDIDGMREACELIKNFRDAWKEALVDPQEKQRAD